MLSFVDRLKTWWTTSDPKQKVTTLGGIGALLLLLLGSAMFLTRPHYVTLRDGLSEKDKAAVVGALEAAGFKPNIDGPGTVQVVEGDRARAEIALSNANVPTDHHAPKEDPGPFAPPEVTKELINKRRQDEIATTLEAMDGVAVASVIITMPENRVFASDQTRPTASVTITEKVPGSLTREDGRTIANYVSHAVDKMTMKDVVVTNSQFESLWDGNDEEATGSKSALDAKVSRFWEAKVQAALDKACGPGNSKVLASANVDTAKRHRIEKTVTPADKATTSTIQKENYQGNARKAVGIAGATPNTSTNANEKAPAAQNGGGSADDYIGSLKTETRDLNTSETVTEDGGGDLKGLSLTVMVNSDKVTDVAGVQSTINGLLGGRIQYDNGVPVPNQPFTATVTSMKFDPTAANEAKEAADKLAGQQRNQQILSLLPIAAVLFIALLVAKQVGKISKAILPAAPEHAAIAEMAEEDVPSALPGEDGPDALPAPAAMFADFEEAAPGFELERFEGQVDVPLESLKMMASERPELVATLIKSMMLGEHAR